MKIIVTKYALSKGMWWIDAEVNEEGYATELPKLPNSCGLFLSRNEYALTEEEARKQFEERRQRRIASLEKSLKKLKGATPKILSE